MPRAPDYVNDCNCTLCTKRGALWAYYRPSEVVIEAATDAITAYTRADLTAPFLSTYHCAKCGCTTHWAPLPTKPQERMGVNVRLFGDEMIQGVELRKIDGRSW